jgi:hypothetical protein
MAKCDGRRFIDSFVNPLIKSNPDLKCYTEYYTKQHEWVSADNLAVREEDLAHQGWDSRISEDTYIVSILRDPIERAASWYAMVVDNKVKVKLGSRQETSLHLDKNKFIEFVKNNTRFHNYYSKMILNDFTNNGSAIFNNSLLQNEDNVNLILSRFKRVNLLFRMEDLAYINKLDISKKIIEDLECNIFYPDLEKNKKSNPYTLPASKLLYESLTEEDKSNLSQYLNMDYAIYNNDSLFWKT